MLKKINRLKARGDFKRTLAGRRLWINDCFVVYGLLRPAQVPCCALPLSVQPRVGFVVSKKVHAKSTNRNLVKRRLRELLRIALKDRERYLILNRFQTLVFIARTGALNVSFRSLEQKMTRCIDNL